jgi:hypothetical protein
MLRCLFLAMSTGVGISIASCSAAEPSSGKELLTFVQEAHKATYESIRTCSCKVEFSLTITNKSPPVTQSCSSDFWGSSDVSRAKVSESGDQTDYLWKDSVRTTVTRTSVNGQAAASASRDAFDGTKRARCDPWCQGLLLLNVPGTIEYVPFGRLVERARSCDKADRKSIGGKPMILVRLSFDPVTKGEDEWDMEVYFDPSVNYLVRKAVYVNRRIRREDEVASFKECAPGVFFPEEIVGRSEYNGSQDTSCATHISNVKVNEPIAEDIFRLRFPNNIILTDGIIGGQYHVDAQGNRISEVKPLAQGPGAPGLEAGVIPGIESESEPWPVSRWILLFSLLVLIAGGIGALVRWRRRRAAES